jgi:hypothetical protein
MNRTCLGFISLWVEGMWIATRQMMMARKGFHKSEKGCIECIDTKCSLDYAVAIGYVQFIFEVLFA